VDPASTWVLFDPTQCYFLDPKGKKGKNLGFFQTQIPKQRWLTLTGSKKFDPDPSLHLAANGPGWDLI